MNDVELSGLEIKPYIHSQKNCRPSASGYVMEPIDSILEIDFSNFDNSKVTIITKRISGNGKVKINGLDYEALSKESNHLELQLTEKKILFIRDSAAIGKIIIVNVIISAQNVLKDINSAIIEQKTISKNPDNWKNLLIKCGDVRGIKLVDDKLLASEAAYIQKGDLIEYIQTEPPQAFTKSNIIKFIYPCEIIAISFNENYNLPPINKNKFQHFPNILNKSIKNNTMTENNKSTNKSNNVLYDSFENGFNSVFFNNTDDVVSGQGKNNNGVIIKKNGSFSIPLSILQPNMQYVIVVEIKKINGNGKFGIELTTTDNVSKSSTITIANDRESELYLKLNTEGPPNPGSTYMLKFFRPEESTTGDVLLNRLILINGITLANFTNPQISKQSTNYIENKFLNKKESDSVRALSKFYSREISYNTTQNLNFSGEITFRSKSSISWFNKINPIYPKIKSSSNSKILFGELGSLTHADKIWLDPFNTKISDEDKDILSKSKTIYSPSPGNIELLSRLFPTILIKLLEKSWPMVEPKSIKHLPNNYTLLFHRDHITTSRIVESYSNEYPTLIIIGALQTYEGNVLQLNEYITYDKVLNILLNAKLLIDIPDYNNYQSGILSLAFDNGIPVATSNLFGLDKNNCKLIIKDKIDELNIPKVIDIKNAIEDGLKLNKLNIDINHNEKINKMLLAIFN